MGLPFLEPKKMATLIVARRGKSDLHDVKPEVDMSEHKDPELEQACESLLKAIDERSITGMSHALIEIHQLTDLHEHEEGPHTNEGE